MSSRKSIAVKMAEVETHVKYIRKGMDEIKETIKDVPIMKAGYQDFQFWKNKIIVGVLVALLVSGILAVVRVAYGPATGSGSQTSRSFHRRP